MQQLNRVMCCTQNFRCIIKCFLGVDYYRSTISTSIFGILFLVRFQEWNKNLQRQRNITTMRIEFFRANYYKKYCKNVTHYILYQRRIIYSVVLQAMLMKIIWYLCNIDQIMATQYETKLHFRFYLINFISWYLFFFKIFYL